MSIISVFISILGVSVIVFLTVYLIERNKPINIIWLYVLSGAITTIIIVFISIFIVSWFFRNGDLATEILSIYFKDNLIVNIIIWLIITPLSKFLVKQ